MCREESSRRDPLNVAQYEVLDVGVEKGAPSRTGRSMGAYTGEAACERPGVEHFYRPWAGRTSLFSIIPQSGSCRILGYFRWSQRDQSS
jgi:hypothetical protein